MPRNKADGGAEVHKIGVEGEVRVRVRRIGLRPRQLHMYTHAKPCMMRALIEVLFAFLGVQPNRRLGSPINLVIY